MIAALSALRGDSRRPPAVVPNVGRAAALPRRVGRTWAMAATTVMLTGLAAASLAHRARTADASSAGPAITLPAPAAAPASDGVEASSDRATCAAGDARPAVAPLASRDLQVAPLASKDSAALPLHGEARKPQTQTQRERDASLMSAMRQAVQQESYLTLPVPDDMPKGWTAQWAAYPSLAVAVH